MALLSHLLVRIHTDFTLTNSSGTRFMKQT